MSTLLKLSGGPRDGMQEQIEDMNHLAVLYPGYSPISQYIDPARGQMVTDAEWTGGELDEAAYQGVLNPKVTESAHDHAEDNADQQYLEGAQEAPEAPKASGVAPPPPPLPPAPPKASPASSTVTAPEPPAVPQVPETP